MLATPQELFDATLELTNKEQTGTLYPNEFEILINQVQQEWIRKTYLPINDGVESTQKRIDDLQTLKDLLILTPISTDTFTLPIFSAPVIPGQHGYMFLLNAAVEINYLNNPCFDDGVSANFCKSKPYKADKMFEIARDPYNMPTDDRPYHEIRGNQVIMYLGDTGSTAARLRIEFVKYPQDILLANAGNINAIDIPIFAREELVTMAAQRFLQITGSPNYPTLLKEMEMNPN